MATNKNITMKQYNGTDYDTLYPKTTTAQVDGLSANFYNKTEADDRYVNATGDTMTGKLQVSMSSAPAVNCINTTSGKNTWMIASNDGTTSISNATDEGNRAIFNIRSEEDLNNIVRIGARKDSSTKWYNILHAGNLNNYIQYGSTDLTAGTSTLATGTLYFVYE